MVQGILSWQFTLLLAMDMPLQLQEQEGKVVEGVSLGGEGREHLKHCLLGRWLFLLLFTQTSSQLKPESHSGFYPLER